MNPNDAVDEIDDEVLDVDVVPPNGVTLVKRSDVKELKRQFRKAGWSVISAKEWAANAEIGKIVREKLGLLHLGCSMYLFSANDIKRALDECAKIVADDSTDPELRVRTIETSERLQGHMISIAKHMVDAGQKMDGAGRKPDQVLPGWQPNVAVQVNVAPNERTEIVESGAP